MDIEKNVNEVLVKLFNEIWQLEEEAIITEEFRDISNNDMHVIEAVGVGNGSSMSKIAKKLKITVGSLTTAMNSLVYKGYVTRERSEVDRRVVNIKLAEKGQKAYYHHENFHKQMVGAIVKQLDKNEAMIFSKSLDKLIKFFRRYNKEQ